MYVFELIDSPNFIYIYNCIVILDTLLFRWLVFFFQCLGIIFLGLSPNGIADSG